MGAYAFQNVQASIIGPGGNVNLGFGAGAAEEGITVEMVEEKGDVKVGADGQIMQSLRSSKLGRITFRYLKTSLINAQLDAMYSMQTTISSLWGNNIIRVADVARGDVVLGTQMAFTKRPNLTYGKDGNTNEWIFMGNVDETLGTGDVVAT